MTQTEFDKEWRAKFETIRTEVLLWEKPFRPAVPSTIDEEVVVSHLKALEPFRRRAEIWPLSVLNKMVRAPFVALLACCNVFTGIGELFTENVWVAGGALWLVLPIWCAGGARELLLSIVIYLTLRWLILKTLTPMLNIILYK